MFKEKDKLERALSHSLRLTGKARFSDARNNITIMGALAAVLVEILYSRCIVIIVFDANSYTW